MKEVAIQLEGIGKKYTIKNSTEGSSDNFREAITKRIRVPSKAKKSTDNGRDQTGEFWALKDINLQIGKGDKVGIIGRNGAGKSTLLKLISRVTVPTTGTISYNGKVASLLEVGTGFHPELSGRENIFLSGAVLGLTRDEIRLKFSEIVEFAEVENFIDMPVKRYSSGMYVRLAFAVAAHLESEILLIDEVLAVGDANFQRKCLGKIDDVSEGGRTILFVSHNLNAVRMLCDKFVYLRQGKVHSVSTNEDIFAEYLSEVTEDEQGVSSIPKKISDLPSDDTVNLEKITFRQHDREVTTHIENGREFEIEVKFSALRKVSGLRVYINLYDEFETLLFRSFHDEDNDQIPTIECGRYVSRCIIPANLLGPIRYRVCVGIGIHSVRTIFTIPIDISVENTGIYNRAYIGDEFRGVIGLHIPWDTKRL